jgi:hypothetical protein
LIIRIASLLAGTLRLRDVDQVDPDAVSERRAAAHPVGQDVRRFEVARSLRMARLPAIETLGTTFSDGARLISLTGINVFRRPVGVGREPPGVPRAACSVIRCVVGVLVAGGD